MNRKIRLGMVGGGKGSFIGGVHRIAANIDGQYELVCGALSSNPANALSSGLELFLAPERCYATVEAMLTAEALLPEGERMDVVSIVTPNHLHYPVAKAAIQAGFHVVCDKPLCLTMDEAIDLQAIVSQSDKLFCLTHNYTGYPMVKEAKSRIAAGQLGKLRKVVVEYPQGWLSTRLEDTGQKQAGWRTDPAKAGAAGCMGDIGTHAENLAEYITGLKIESLCADLSSMVAGRALDDDGNVLLRFYGGAKGVLHASQISNGEENSLKIYIYGELGGMEWHQMEPNSLILKTQDGKQVIRTGVGALSAEAKAATRIPAGHPEGYLEAFANLYKGFALALRHHHMPDLFPSSTIDYPSIEDGVRGMRFLAAVVSSSQKGAIWVQV